MKSLRSAITKIVRVWQQSGLSLKKTHRDKIINSVIFIFRLSRTL